MKITEEKQADILSRHGRGSSGREISRTTGISRGTVLSVIKRGKVKHIGKKIQHPSIELGLFDDATEQTCLSCRRNMLIRAGEDICLECSITKGIKNGKIQKTKTI